MTQDNVYRDSIIESCALELETAFPGHAWVNAACAALRASKTKRGPRWGGDGLDLSKLKNPDGLMHYVPPITEGMVRKGGRNQGPSQITERPPAPAPINRKGAQS